MERRLRELQPHCTTPQLRATLRQIADRANVKLPQPHKEPLVGGYTPLGLGYANSSIPEGVGDRPDPLKRPPLHRAVVMQNPALASSRKETIKVRGPDGKPREHYRPNHQFFAGPPDEWEQSGPVAKHA